MKKGSFSQLFTVVCYAVALAAQLSFSMIIATLNAEGKLDGATGTYVSYLVPQVCYLLVLTVFLLVQRVPMKMVFQPKNVNGTHYIYALLIGLGLFFLALLPNGLLQGLIQRSGSSSTVTLPPTGTAGEITLTVLLLCVLPAIGEEMIFRKTFCEGMKGNNEWVIVLLGGLFFSLTHFNLVQTVHQFVLGCVLCLLYVRTGNITLTILIHFMNNLLAVFLESWTAGRINWSSWTTLGISFAAGACLLALGLILAIKKTKKTEGGEEKVAPYTIGMIVVGGVIWAVSAVSSFWG